MHRRLTLSSPLTLALTLCLALTMGCREEETEAPPAQTTPPPVASNPATAPPAEAPDEAERDEAHAQHRAAAPTDIKTAVAVLHPTEGNDTTGVVRFTQTPEGIQVVGQVNGLTAGEHGFHVHQWGDCSAADATSAGGHFAPEGDPHAAPTAEARHTGDLGNITANDSGLATISHTDQHLAFTGERSIIGRAVIVHAGRDDLTSQPSGSAGPRVACGVIGVAATE